MADAAAAANQAASAAKMEDAAQHTPPRPPEQTPNNAFSNSLESHRSVQVLHQRLAQPQAQQRLAPTQQSVDVHPPGASGHSQQPPAGSAAPQLLSAAQQAVPQPAAAAQAVLQAAAAPVQAVKQEPSAGTPAGAAAAEASRPDHVLVAAGALQGSLNLNTLAVISEGRVMKPTEFQAAAGITSHKSWKQLLRVVLPDWGPGHWPTLERWLAEQYPAAPPLPALQPAARPKRQKEAKAPGAARPSAPAARRPPPPQQPDQPQRATGPDILAHLSRQYIGLLPTDPTAAALPAELPKREGVKVLDLNAMSAEDIAAAARATAAAGPFAARLPDLPGVRRSRQAFITGQAPAKRPRLQAQAAPGAAEASFWLGEYLEGKRTELPWEAMGLTKAPVMAGEELDVRALHAVVQAHGGYDAVTKGRLWARIAGGLAIPLDYQNAGTVLRGHYQRLLLRHDRQVSAARSYSTRQATAAASAVSDTPLQRSASPASRAGEASDAGDAPPSPMLDEAAQHVDVDATTSSAPNAAVHAAAAPAEAANTADITVEGAAAGAEQSVVTAILAMAADSAAGATVADQRPQTAHVEAAGSREAPIDLEAAAVQSAGGVGTLCNNIAHCSSPVAEAQSIQTVPAPSDWGQAAGQGSGIPGL